MWFPERFRRSPPAQRKPTRSRLTVEALEDRCLPASGLSAALVADILPGSAGSDPIGLFPVGSTLFFSASDQGDENQYGRPRELYKSDGTAAGTVLVKDINPGDVGSAPGNFTNVGGTLYFTANDGMLGRELWKSDGAAAGTVLVKDINPAADSSNPGSLTAVNDTLFFAASNQTDPDFYDNPTNTELWKSDGTAAGTILVKDINPGSSGSGPEYLTSIGGTLYFAASDGVHGVELWTSDGTAAGTVLVKDINPGGSSSPGDFTSVGGTIYFSAYTANEGRELWKSDGTPEGTVLVKDIFTGESTKTAGKWGGPKGAVHLPNSSSPLQLTDVNGRLYFTATNGDKGKGNGRELWTSDGTAKGTVLVRDINPGSASAGGVWLTNVNGLLYFAANDGVHSTELWQSDGTADGTVLVQDINPGSAHSAPAYLVAMNNKLYFTADDGIHGRELWDPPPVDPTEQRPVSGGVDVVPADPNDWPMFNHDPEGSRHNYAETRLRPDNVAALQELWRFPTDGAVASTPAVDNDVVYAADTTGAVYAVYRDGTLKWKTILEIPALVSLKLSSSPLVTNRTVIVGDNAGFIHGLDVETGQPRWRINSNPHPFAALFGNGTMIGNYVAFGTSSFELFIPAIDPTYTKFTFRGSVVLLDPADGRILWQTFTISDEEHAAGASGATVWGAPAYDRASNTLFVGTSNNYSQPTTNTSDALIALDGATGAIKWVSQKTGGDHWNFSFLPEDPDDPPDFDFGDSPQLYRLGGRLVVAAGQKSGFFHVVNAETGAEVATPQQFLPGDHLGGFHIDSAFAGGVNFAPGNDWFDPFSGNPPDSGHLTALSAAGTETLWQVDLPAPVIAGVAVANGVVYLQSIDGLFYAFDAGTGAELARRFTGGQNSGPAVSRGQVYLGTGDTMSAVFNPFFVPGPAHIIALGLPDDSSLQAASPGRGSAKGALTTAPAAALVAEALARWQAAGADTSRLAPRAIRITDLPGATLGLASGHTIWLDIKAAGNSWFYPTPGDDSAITTPGDQGEQHGIDLLTVLMHEPGHLLGHDQEEEGVMAETLSAGTRLTLLDAAFCDADRLFGLPNWTRKREPFLG